VTNTAMTSSKFKLRSVSQSLGGSGLLGFFFYRMYRTSITHGHIFQRGLFTRQQSTNAQVWQETKLTLRVAKT
jgi:hypothetical protein